MKFNTENPDEAAKATKYLELLLSKGHIVEVKRISRTRSLNQNSYLHLLIGYFGQHFGYTIEEAKQIYKQFNRDIYVYKKNETNFIRSSADLSVEDMTKSIDVFRQKSDEAGLPLPPADNPEWLRSIENEIERSRYYL